MSRILILGVSPLPFESTERSFGPGTRTWQLTAPLLADGHEVSLIGTRIPMTYPEDAPPETVERKGRLTYASIRADLFYETDYVRRACDELRPDAVIFAHGAASYADWIIDPQAPIWIDLCGHVMAEAQAKAAVYGDDSYVDYFFHRMLSSIFRGDVFSTVSDAQRYALIGELGLAGRLNSLTNGFNLVHTIPCGAEEDDYHHETRVLRGIDLDERAFVVLWSGGFNTWTDVETLFGGLEYAMNRDPSVHFVATGGQIDGHDEISYPRFVEMVTSSPNRSRYLLKGWLPRALVPNFYFEADVGINCEKDIYEVRLGSKHRVLDWSRAALPVVTTRVTELSMAIEEDGVGFVCDAGDPEALGKAILEAVAQRSTLTELGERCRQAMRRRYGFAVTTKALREWAHEPRFAPDRGRRLICLEAIVDPSAVSASGDGHAGAAEPASSAQPACSDPTRLHWLRRVIRQSYADGGVSMVIRRAWRLARGKRTE